MSNSASPIRILLADDQQLFVDNLKLMLETLAEDIRVTGIAMNGREAIALAEAEMPDIILMDIRMPDMDGVEAAKILHRKYPAIKIVMLTTFLEDDYVEVALKNGAYGYILKNIKSDDLVASIRAIFRGSALFSPTVLEKLLHLTAPGPETAEDHDEYRDIVGRLGRREREILTLVGKGYTNQKIADALFISEPTVRNYISSIYAKVGIKDRLEVMTIAQKGRLEKD
ncbi:MAG: response regulator transcription factor [Treponema sp.]|jgi:DNA-binding NarL/FixJ family response regulator|nr:response regulator transcription factor [Treponema sp.]